MNLIYKPLVIALLSLSTIIVPLQKDPEAKEEAKKERVYFTCGMHPQVKLDHAGDCPICGMKLQKVEIKDSASEAAQPNAPKKIKFYRNPMNPKITSPVPTKDDMGMDYIPVYEESNAPGVPATFTLNAIQLKNLRAELVSVKIEDLIYEIDAPGRVLSSNQLAFQVYEQDLANVKVGQKVFAKSPFAPEREIEGKVFSVDSFLDPMTRTSRVNVLVSQAPSLRVEGSLSGRILTTFNQRLVVPASAILHTGLQDYVFVYRDGGIFEPRTVVLGVKAHDFYEVKEGLKEGEQVSKGPNFLLDAEARIRGLTGGEPQ